MVGEWDCTSALPLQQTCWHRRAPPCVSSTTPSDSFQRCPSPPHHRSHEVCSSQPPSPAESSCSGRFRSSLHVATDRSRHMRPASRAPRSAPAPSETVTVSRTVCARPREPAGRPGDGSSRAQRGDYRAGPMVIADGTGRVGLRSENRDRCRRPVSARHTTHCPHDNAENPSGRFEGHRKTSGSWRF